jgi:hypothetical protein
MLLAILSKPHEKRLVRVDPGDSDSFATVVQRDAPAQSLPVARRACFDCNLVGAEHEGALLLEVPLATITLIYVWITPNAGGAPFRTDDLPRLLAPFGLELKSIRRSYGNNTLLVR